MHVSTLAAIDLGTHWHTFWRTEIGHWLLTKGLRMTAVIIGALIATRFIGWAARKISQRIAAAADGDTIVRSETVKHRQAVASVISSVLIGTLYFMVVIDIAGTLGFPVGSLVAPAAVLGAALGFGAQRIVQDLLSGFFIITERQYGFGDLVSLSVTGVSSEARGTVEDVTLRVTKLRTPAGEVSTIPNGQIVKSQNLSKDWAQAVVDVPVPVSTDLNAVNDVLQAVAADAAEDEHLAPLLLDKPALMGVESIEVDTVMFRMVARTLPGKQFEAGRRLRAMVVAALRRAGIVTPNGTTPEVDATGHREPEPAAR
jgi:moderate conductance mechanosensitive channel